MDSDLKYYQTANRDCRIGSVPFRQGNGNYKWSNGQEIILNQIKFRELRNVRSEKESLEKQKETLLKQMINYQNPVNDFVQESDTLLKTWQLEIDEEHLMLKQFKTELNQFDEDMRCRGESLVVDQPQDVVQEKKESRSWINTLKQNVVKWKVFFMSWIVIEFLISGLQWSILRDIMSFSEIFLRIAAFGVTLFLFELVAFKNRKAPNVIYYIYMVFNLFMLLFILILPFVLNKIYPTSNSSLQEAYSLLNGDSVKLIENKHPLWVELIRSFEIAPAVFALLFYIAIGSFMKNKEEVVNLETTELPINDSHLTKDYIRDNRLFLKSKINECESRIASMLSSQSLVISPNTINISNILNSLKEAQESVLNIETQISLRNTRIDEIFNQIELELNLYKAEYMSALSNNAIKSSFVQPEWPNRNDIVKFFNI